MTLGPLLVDVAGTELTRADREFLAHPGVGGVILFAANYVDPAQLGGLTASIRSIDDSLLIVADTEGGRVQRFRAGFTRLPAMRRLGPLFESNPEWAIAAAADIGWLLAAELVAAGVDLPLAPVVDLAIDGLCSEVIGDRALSGNPAAVRQLAQALASGLRDAGSAATAKHFPGHGAVVGDSHRELPVDDRPSATLNADMAIYERLIADGLESVMPAHVRYPAVDEAPASLSSRWIEDRLRGQLGFEGAVICDDLTMAGAAVAGAPDQRAVAALAAGCDFLPLCHDRANARRAADRLQNRDTADSQNRRHRLLDTVRARQAVAVGLAEDTGRERAGLAHQAIAVLSPEV